MLKVLLNVFLLVLFSFLLPTESPAFKQIDWASINPSLKSAIPVNDTTECLDCHDDYIESFEKTKHAKAYRAIFGWSTPASCEACHGPLSNHLKEKDLDKKLDSVVSFKNISPEAKNSICMQCHEKGQSRNWMGSTHESAGVSCTNCHYVMTKRSKSKLFIKGDSIKVCFQCHRDKRAKMERASHMPLREGKMSCTGCHNPHGSFGPNLLQKATVNETCSDCHQDKRGPMLWEHAPVRENCSTCHDPHGSNFQSMLKRKPPYLCQQCHMDSFHPSSVYDGTQINAREAEIVGKSCINCHSMIHGSNHPSGARFQR
ncbi:MAG: hypothetical protein COV66_03835 [Nitrospinae bacterium CG11_big_fil_rev_8_21_14_0_20_45_15]|nr:MAG: hypothetical protein COV66_03835 [Nitrospinae bacterium CG11_big_fil_rev_8_21_14_0_20_45_15]